MRQLQNSIRDGEWFVVDRGMKIAVIVYLEIGPRRQRMYRSVTWAEVSADRRLIGYFPDLPMAAHITWREYKRVVPT